MLKTKLSDVFLPYAFRHFDPKSLTIHSQVLSGNPLGDPHVRHNYCLVPKKQKTPLPVVFHLNGYFSTGYQAFQVRSFESNIPQWIDQDTHGGKLSDAIHIFVEASTYWGGSQFIDSPGSGAYGTYLRQEVVSASRSQFDLTEDWTVVGGSSGGYGALQWISHGESPFTRAIAISPDSFFEASLLPELFKVGPQWVNFENTNALRQALDSGELQKKRYFFPLVNAMAMAHCYNREEDFKKDHVVLPIDTHTGVVDKDHWNHWLGHDPVVFLGRRLEALENKKIFLDVGRYDEYSLQFGTRQIATILKANAIEHELTEYNGTHRGLSERRRVLLQKYLGPKR